MPNRKGVLECRFVTLKPAAGEPLDAGISHLYCPVSHGEGNFFCTEETLARIERENMVAFRYCRDDLSPAGGEYPYNPNGALADIAGITSADGKVLGMMPHPERAMEFVNLYDWPTRKERLKREGKPLPTESMNMRFFRNIVAYFGEYPSGLPKYVATALEREKHAETGSSRKAAGSAAVGSATFPARRPLTPRTTARVHLLPVPIDLHPERTVSGIKTTW